MLLTVAVIHELRLKLEGGGKPPSSEALLTNLLFMLTAPYPPFVSTYFVCSLERYVFSVYCLITTAFKIDKPYILFIGEKNLRMPIFIIFQYKYIS